MGFLDEFSAFLKEYKVLGLAVAFIIGVASKELVSALVDDLIMPVVNVLIPGGNWQEFVLEIAGIKFMLGHFMAAVIDFIIIAFVIFMIVKVVMKEEKVTKK